MLDAVRSAVAQLDDARFLFRVRSPLLQPAEGLLESDTAFLHVFGCLQGGRRAVRRQESLERGIDPALSLNDRHHQQQKRGESHPDTLMAWPPSASLNCAVSV